MPDNLLKDFIKKHVSKWMVDDGNNKLLWKDKAPTVNEILDLVSKQTAEAQEQTINALCKVLNTRGISVPDIASLVEAVEKITKKD